MSSLLDSARACPGPDWLRARRAASVERFAAGSLPTADEEIWRYSRIGELDLGRYSSVGAPSIRTSGLGGPSGPVIALSDHPQGDLLLGSIAGDSADAFSELAVATLGERGGLVVDVPAGVVVSEPIRIDTTLRGDGIVVGARLVVRVGEGAEVTIIERTSCDDDTAVLFLPVVELDVAATARVRYVSVQDLGARAWQVGLTASRTGRDASLRTMAVALGGDYARLRTDAAIVAPGGYNELLAVYFGEGTQMHDFRTIQDHAAPRTTSDLKFKGAVEGKSTSVYSGLIRIAKGARGTVAQQSNRTLILSDDAAAESVPNLEIEENDVRCNHASAVGPIDEEHRYYLESRGVAPDVAERLIVVGFFDDILERIPDPALVAQLTAAITAKFERRVPADGTSGLTS